MSLDPRRVWLARAAALDLLVEAGQMDPGEAIGRLMQAFWAMEEFWATAWEEEALTAETHQRVGRIGESQ